MFLLKHWKKNWEKMSIFNSDKVKIEAAIHEWNSFYPYQVVVWDKNGELIEERAFNNVEQAGAYIMKVEAFYRYCK